MPASKMTPQEKLFIARQSKNLFRGRAAAKGSSRRAGASSVKAQVNQMRKAFGLRSSSPAGRN